MQVAFHLGAHSTDADRLVGALAANPSTLEERKICLPRPAAYRTPLREALTASAGGPASIETQDHLLAVCADGGYRDGVARLVLSHGNFLGAAERLITTRGLYPFAGDKLGPLANLFPEDESEFFFALINPAVFAAALVARQSPRRSYEDVMSGQPPEELRWAPVVSSLAEGARGRKLVVWCNEDMPLIQPEIVRALGGLPPNAALNGDDSILEQVLGADGLNRYRAYRAEHPVLSIEQRRRATTIFLEKFARRSDLEVEIDMPGWDEGLIDEITARYEEDVATIRRMEGVTFIAP